MTVKDFACLIPAGTRIPTDEEMRMINVVAMHHPCLNTLSGNEDVVKLYVKYGIRIIADMYDTALKAKSIDVRRQELKDELLELEREAEELAMI